MRARDVDLRGLAERVGDDLGEHAPLHVVGGDGLPEQRRRAGVELAQRGAGAAREHQDVVRDRDRGRGGDW